MGKIKAFDANSERPPTFAAFALRSDAGR